MKTFLNSLSRSTAHRIGGLSLAVLWAASWMLLGHHLDADADKLAEATSSIASLAHTGGEGQGEGVKGIAAAREARTPAYRTKKIQDIRVGERVMVDLPAEARAAAIGKLEELTQVPSWDHEEVDPATWRQIELAMPDEHGGRFDIVLLRPLGWLEEERAEVGRPVCLSMPEQGLDGPAEVLAIGPCPPILPGSGRVVTGTFTHIRSGVIELHVAGLDEPIGVTENHPIYSLDRQEFVHAAELNVGERLQLVDGITHVVAINPIVGKHRVYNFEVHGEHVYHVSRLGLLVHNASPGRFPGTAEEMDELMGFRGTRRPDFNPQTGQPLPGRGRVDWDISTPLGRLRITFEAHPYDVGAPDFHVNPHWHVHWPGMPHHFLPGDPFPGWMF
jgi:hypothetical protein